MNSSIACARGASIGFALTLLTSAWLKAHSPHEAAAALRWTGITAARLVGIVDLLGLAEAALAGALLFWSRARITQGIATCVAVSLGFAHVISASMSTAPCGCFGDVDVPRWLTLGILVVGASSSALLFRSLKRTRVRLTARAWRAGAVVLVSGLAALPMALRRPADSPPVEQLVAMANLPHATEELLFVIGSSGCPHCRDAIRDIGRDSSMSDIPVVLVVRDDDARTSDGVERLAVPSELWWQLIDDAPPAFLHYRIGQPLALSSRWNGRQKSTLRFR